MVIVTLIETIMKFSLDHYNVCINMSNWRGVNVLSNVELMILSVFWI
jgi:hypothetical protein